MGSDRGTEETDPRIVGHVNEAEVFIYGIKTTALLDTGSCVSIISETFYKNN